MNYHVPHLLCVLRVHPCMAGCLGNGYHHHHILRHHVLLSLLVLLSKQIIFRLVVIFVDLTANWRVSTVCSKSFLSIVVVWTLEIDASRVGLLPLIFDINLCTLVAGLGTTYSGTESMLLWSDLCILTKRSKVNFSFSHVWNTLFRMSSDYLRTVWLQYSTKLWSARARYSAWPFWVRTKDRVEV